MNNVESGDDVIIRVEGAIGRITLNRPKALNAISYAMVKQIDAALDAWCDDPAVTAVVIDGAGEKAFCAGGDIMHLYENGRADPEVGRPFWADEYRLNSKIAHYPKPYIALMDGITMGGGVGLSVHGSHRIVTERSMIAMPEVGIGFLPDVGGTHILAKAPGHTGLYLGMSGARMNAADAIFAGFADTHIPSKSIKSLIEALASGVDVDAALKSISTLPDAWKLVDLQPKISTAFDHSTALQCVAHLDTMAETGDEWAIRTRDTIRKASPTSVAATFYAVRNAATLPNLEACLAVEYRFAFRTLIMHDFYEGVRAVLVDKDNNPKWQPSRLEDVTDEMILAAFADIGEREWRLA
ncbi:MAG: hypothetical protein COA52_16690 [Hyphomicrobiales bacterium]|nr:MAG: hypothetical protein COA52_16690 [Hyphomicrobiales bacterium]